jgi:hypothetical protein
LQRHVRDCATKAAEVQEKVSKQERAIDTFLGERDRMLAQLEPLLEPMRKLAELGNPSWVDNPGSCYIFPDAASFLGALRGIPKELLPADFACPTLSLIVPGERSLGKSAEAAMYLQYCIGILRAFCKGSMAAHTKEADDSLLLDLDTDTTESTCMVCEHSKVEAINNALKEGRSLRDIEAEFGISRSTLHRHKKRCLNLSAIRIME